MKKIDIFFNFLYKLFVSLLYLCGTLVASMILIWGNIVFLNIYNITFIGLANPTYELYYSILWFLLSTCLIIVLFSEVMIRFVLKNTENGDFLYYEFIDNLYKFLVIWGVIYQIAMFESNDITVKISQAVLMGIVVGFQQLILKIWFKSVRTSQGINIVQSVYDRHMIRQYKERLKPTIQAMGVIKEDTNSSEVNNIVQPICSILCEKRYSEIIMKYKKEYKSVIEALESKELKALFDTFEKHDKPSKAHLKAGIEKINIISKGLKIN